MRRWLLLFLLLLVAVLPAQAQEGRGTLRMAIAGDISSFNFSPLECALFDCLSDLLFPRLLYVAPDTQAFAAPPADSFAVAASWEMTDEGIILHLREDLLWSDGTPITSYDVLFSYIAYYQYSYQWQLYRQVVAAVPLDASTIQFIYSEMNCDALNSLNFTVMPAHAFYDDFAARAAEVFADGYSEEALLAWREIQPQYTSYNLSSHPFFNEPNITAGEFRFHSRQYGAYVRLISNDGMQGIELVGSESQDARVDMLMRGEIDLADGFDLERIHDLRADQNVRVFELPTTLWVGVSLNFADPYHPQPAYDEDGNALEQGQHPIFNDLTVRRALQLATDVPALLGAFAEGLGTVMPANMPRGTWAFDDTLIPLPYDPMSAARMLHNAGWRDINGDGVRECSACTSAPPFTQLSFELRVPYGWDYSLANMLTQQWSDIGVRAYINEGDAFEQTFDAALIADWLGYPANVDQYLRFTPAGDDFYSWNIGSYNNPEVTDLLQRARSVPGCAQAERAELYHEVQRVLQDDQPYIWLFSVNNVAAARTTVANIAPYPNALFWNLRDWVIER